MSPVDDKRMVRKDQYTPVYCCGYYNNGELSGLPNMAGAVAASDQRSDFAFKRIQCYRLVTEDSDGSAGKERDDVCESQGH